MELKSYFVALVPPTHTHQKDYTYEDFRNKFSPHIHARWLGPSVFIVLAENEIDLSNQIEFACIEAGMTGAVDIEVEITCDLRCFKYDDEIKVLDNIWMRDYHTQCPLNLDKYEELYANPSKRNSEGGEMTS